jgi:hypothetical protein
MATKNMKRVVFYLDSETRAILNEIPPFLRSSTIRNMVKKAASEGWLHIPVHNAIGPATATPLPESKQDAATPITLAPPPVPSIRPPMQEEEANHGEWEEALTDSEETLVEVEPPPDKMDEPDELDENDPANYEEAFAEETKAAPPLEIVELHDFVPIEEPPAALIAPTTNEEVAKKEKPARQFRSMQEAIDFNIEL